MRGLHQFFREPIILNLLQMHIHLLNHPHQVQNHIRLLIVPYNYNLKKQKNFKKQKKGFPFHKNLGVKTPPFGFVMLE